MKIKYIGEQETFNGDSFGLYTILDGPHAGTTVTWETIRDMIDEWPDPLCELCGRFPQDDKGDGLCPTCREQLDREEREHQAYCRSKCGDLT